MGYRAGLPETLELLNDIHLRRGTYVAKVEEDIEHRPGVLTRYSTIHLEIPSLGLPDVEISPELPFVYVLRTAPRGHLWTVSDCSVSVDGGCRLLGHQEHQYLASLMIHFRFWSVVGTWVSEEIPDRWDLAMSVCRRLMQIPHEEEVSANAILNEIFTDEGDLQVFPGIRVVPSMARRLFRLCETLTTRYFVCLAFNAEAGAQVAVEYTQEDRLADVDANFLARTSATNKMRMALGAVPVQIAFCAPLSRITSSYELRLQTSESVYVQAQTFLELASEKGEELAYRTIAEGPDGSTTWRGAAGTSKVHLFLADGNRAEKRVHIGMKVFERLPGSYGRATSVAAGSTVACVLLALMRWISKGQLNGDAAALGVAAFSLIAFGADTIAKRESEGFVVVSSRLSLLTSTFLLFLFSLWLIVPPTVGVGDSGFQSLASRAWVRAGWIPILVAMIANTRWIYKRLHQGYRAYLRAVPRIDPK